MDLADLTNAPRTITLAGREFTVSHMKMKEWGVVQAWIKANIPGPMESLKATNLDELSPFLAHWVTTAAVREEQAWPPRPGSRSWIDALDRVGKDGRLGTVVFMHEALKKHQSTLTYADTETLYDTVEVGEALALFNTVLGIKSGPKDEPPTGGETPTTP